MYTYTHIYFDICNMLFESQRNSPCYFARLTYRRAIVSAHCTVSIIKCKEKECNRNATECNFSQEHDEDRCQEHCSPSNHVSDIYLFR